MDDNNIFWKFCIGIITTVLGWGAVAFQRNNVKHDMHYKRLAAHDTKIAVFDEQLKGILDKLDGVIDLGSRIEASNKTILRALARKSKEK